MIYGTNVVGNLSLVNFAGCDANGGGGAATMDGNPFLVPVGTKVVIPSDKRYPTGEWVGTKWKKYRGRYAKKKGGGTVAEVTNYAFFPSGLTGKTYPEKKGGGMKNVIYYHVIPATDLGEDAS